jgi:hypothetical protein
MCMRSENMQILSIRVAKLSTGQANADFSFFGRFMDLVSLCVIVALFYQCDFAYIEHVRLHMY